AARVSRALHDALPIYSSKEALAAAAIQVKVAGRIMLNRGAFMVLQDMSGRIQVYVDRKGLSAETLEAIKTWDLGDIIAAEGTLRSEEHTSELQSRGKL